jgi:hypothetical protein
MKTRATAILDRGQLLVDNADNRSDSNLAEHSVSDLLRQKRDAFQRASLERVILEARAELSRLGLTELAERTAALTGRLGSARVRVTAIGAVKSGKSTLVNALLGEDVLPRGSGILTALVTRVVTGSAPGARATFKGVAELNSVLANHLEGLGAARDISGGDAKPWELTDEADRAEARVLALAGAGPHRGSVLALLDGYDTVPWREGTVEGELSDLVKYAASEEAAIFIDELTLTVPAIDVPGGLVLMDCQGSDAWNAAHHAGVEEALMEADALVYVFSSRIGLREADFRLIRTIREFGLIDATKFVMNVDLGELRTVKELSRLRNEAQSALAREGATGGVECFSALHSLIERRMMIDPDSVWEGEQRLLEVWKGHDSDFLVQSLETFREFREELWELARHGRDETLTVRVRGELRRILVEASQVTHHRMGADATARRSDASAKLISWVEKQLGSIVDNEAQRISREVANAFLDKKAPQRKAWHIAVEAFHIQPATLLTEAGNDSAAATALYRSKLREHLAEALRTTEPLRVNSARNHALEARGRLAREGERLAGDVAERLQAAGYNPEQIPDRTTFSREITVTRKVPLFAACLAEGDAPQKPKDNPLKKLAYRLLGKHRATGIAALTAETAAIHAAQLHTLKKSWEGYTANLIDQCLKPHVDEAAEQVFARLASWILVQVSGSNGVLGALAELDEE